MHTAVLLFLVHAYCCTAILGACILLYCYSWCMHTAVLLFLVHAYCCTAILSACTLLYCYSWCMHTAVLLFLVHAYCCTAILSACILLYSVYILYNNIHTRHAFSQYKDLCSAQANRRRGGGEGANQPESTMLDEVSSKEAPAKP